MTETLLYALILIPCLIIAIVFHEVAHGWVALMLGDPTAKERRRLTLNPLRHLDPIGTVILPGFLALTGLPVFGWAKPVPVDQARLDNPRYGMMAVAAAGPATNFVLAGIGAVLAGLLLALAPAPEAGWSALLATGLTSFIAINIFLALFNLLPIPPFDGSHIIEGLLPPAAARVYARLRPLGMPLLLLVLLVIPWLFPELNLVENLVVPPWEWVYSRYLALAAFIGGVA